ncbi:hypothetical protein CBM2614_B150080 [Cupriavidus taiwanensis]|nr:hypothetical protein CBM2614_B150080 [Cupriavidus taiwanensis]
MTPLRGDMTRGRSLQAIFSARVWYLHSIPKSIDTIRYLRFLSLSVLTACCQGCHSKQNTAKSESGLRHLYLHQVLFRIAHLCVDAIMRRPG